MKSYVMILLGTSLLTGMLGVICPRKHQKYLRVLCGFCVIAVLVSPLPRYLATLDDRLSSVEEVGDEESVKKYNEIYHEALLEANQTQLEAWLQSHFINEFSLESKDLSVTVILTEGRENVSVKKTIVCLSGRAIFVDPAPMISFVEDTLFCPCEIVYNNAEK